MDLNHLKTFVTVAEEQHLTRAAERLFTSQPAVSAQLRALEDTLGLTLFDRTPKGMRLTRAGERLLTQAQKILEATQLMVVQARAMQGTIMGSLKIGTNSDFEFLRLGALMQDTHERYPHLQLSFVAGMSTDILLDIRKGKLDAGFIFGPCASADIHMEHLATVDTALIAPIEWAGRVQKASMEQLAQLPWVYTTNRCPFFHITEQLFNEFGVEPKKAVFVDNEDAIRTLVRAGSGIALMRGDGIGLCRSAFTRDGIWCLRRRLVAPEGVYPLLRAPTGALGLR